jgi:hypothetical protein
VKDRPAVRVTLFFITAPFLNFLMETVAYSSIHCAKASNRLQARKALYLSVIQ